MLGSTSPVVFLRNRVPANQFSADLTRIQIRAQDPNERTGYVHQASFGPEFQLTKSMVLDLTYVGNFGRNMNRLRHANQGQVTCFDASGQPIVVVPYANLNNNAIGQHAFLESATNESSTDDT